MNSHFRKQNSAEVLVAEQLFEVQQGGIEGILTAQCFITWLSMATEWFKKGRKRWRLEGAALGGGTEDDDQEVEWGIETEVLMSLILLTTLAQLCARFIR